MKRRLLPETDRHFWHRHWIWALAVVLATATVLTAQSAWAADSQVDVRQTVPPPPTRESAPEVPTPTPRPERNDRNDNDSNAGGQDSAATDIPAMPAGTDAGVAPAQVAGDLTAVVTAVTLNVREGPGTGFPVVGKLNQGDSVTVSRRNEAGDWWYVCCVTGTETAGWVSNAFLTPDFDSDQAAALSISPTEPGTPPASVTGTVFPVQVDELSGTVDAVTLNVRSGPGTENNVVGKLAQANIVQVLEQNQAGDWWYVCCVAGTETAGWVSAEFITPNFNGEAAEILAVAEGTAAVSVASEAVATPDTPPEPVVTPAPTSEAPVPESAAPSATPALALTISAQPPTAIQGKTITLVFDVDNTGGGDAINVDLRNVLPAQLTLVKVTAADGGVASLEGGADGTTVLDVVWTTLPAGASTSATALVEVGENLADGTVFDNLASVTADNAEEVGAGISIGLPPALLPEFW